MKEEPKDLKDYEGLWKKANQLKGANLHPRVVLCRADQPGFFRGFCDMWKKANQLKGANLHPRVVLCRADFRIHERRGSPRLPHIKEEQEEVTIKQEEEQFSSSPTRLCVKHEDEEDLPLLLLYDTPDRRGYIRALTFQRTNLRRRPLDCEDFTNKRETLAICSTSTSLENGTGPRGRSNTDEEQISSSMDHSENRSIEQSGGGRFQKSPQKSLRIHSLRGGRSRSAKRNNAANEEQHESPSVDPKEKGHAKKTFRCADCGTSFTFMSNLYRHMLIHAGKKPFSCPACARKFARKDYLSSHVSACHPDRFPYSCTVCKKGLLSAKALKTHMLGHAREKKPVCSECGNTFASQKNLNEHMRIHTGEYPLNCSLCNKGFMGHPALEVHMRSHTGERPFSCSECGEEFKLIAHYRNHMRIHSGEKPFSCPVCKRGFYRSTHATSHMKVHRRQKPFNCKVCYKGFTTKDGYRAHMKIHYVQEKYGVTSYGCFK